jgi:hypothetical protein
MVSRRPACRSGSTGRGTLMDALIPIAIGTQIWMLKSSYQRLLTILLIEPFKDAELKFIKSPSFIVDSFK